jgi:hypothetical protein
LTHPGFSNNLNQAIFTIPDTQSVVQDNIGMGWFVGAIFVLLVVTIVVAAFLSRLMGLAKTTGDQIFDLTQFVSNGIRDDISPKPRPESPEEGRGGKLSTPSASSSNKVSGVSALNPLQGTGQGFTAKWRTRVTRILGQRRLSRDSQQGVEYLDVQVRDKDGAV